MTSTTKVSKSYTRTKMEGGREEDRQAGREGRMEAGSQAGRQGGREGGKDGGTVKAKSPWRVLDKISRHLKSRILFM